VATLNKYENDHLIDDLATFMKAHVRLVAQIL